MIMAEDSTEGLKLGESIQNDIVVTWKKSEKETPFPARDGHCAVGIQNKLYIFGGVQSMGTMAEVYETNKLFCYDLETGLWTTVVTKGDHPPARFAATMSAVGSTLYLFGGLSRESGWFNDLHKFDTGTSTWSCIDAEGQRPSSRDKIASAVIGNDVYIFGGFGPQVEVVQEDDDHEWEDEGDDDAIPQDQDAAQFTWFDDIFVFNTITNTWSNPMQMNLQKPTPRAAMTMCAIDIYLCIFGGRDSEARQNDMHIFNTVTRKWETEAIRGLLPDPRSYHTATTVGKCIVVLGGRGVDNQHFADFHIFDLETKQWLQPEICGVIPTARGLHTATLVGDQLMIFGGSAEFNPLMNQCLKYFNDLHTVEMREITKSIPIACTSKERLAPEAGPAGDTGAKSEPSSDKQISFTPTEIEQKGPSPTKKCRFETGPS